MCNKLEQFHLLLCMGVKNWSLTVGQEHRTPYRKTKYCVQRLFSKREVSKDRLSSFLQSYGTRRRSHGVRTF